MKISNYTIGNRIRDLPTCSAVPQPSAPPLLCRRSYTYNTASFVQEIHSGYNILHLDGNQYTFPCMPFTFSASCTMGTGSFPGAKSGRGVTLTPHPLLLPLDMKEQSYTSTPLWAVRPVQSLSACTRVTFTFTINFLQILVEFKMTNLFPLVFIISMLSSFKILLNK